MSNTDNDSFLDHLAPGVFPARLSAIESWHRHIPFAFALLDMVRPDVFVELGTHRGDSYSAFCQSVVRLGLPTRCFAVDTWQGDSQAGYYGDEIYGEFSTYHDARFSHFSTLMRMTFDDALAHVADGSVDLLHIDGLHTYEAVRHDFETWLPKLSDRGVVLLHDTNVRRGDFGVWRLWRELCERHQGFEFPFGFGLGVLLVGARVPEPLRRFVTWAQVEPQRAAALFFALGDGIALDKNARRLRQLDARLAQLEPEVERLHRELERRDGDVKHRDNQLDEVRDRLKQQELLLGDRLRLLRSEERLWHREQQLMQQLQQVTGSRLWRWRNRLLQLLGQGHRVVSVPPPLAAQPQVDVPETPVETPWPPLSRPRIDIIIPVYRDLALTRRCIDSVLASRFAASAEVIVIDDASPEPELSAWLDTLGGRVTLLRNERNLGFVATVNRGMVLHRDRDVLLLNSDTEVSGDWLDRLQRAAYSERRAGTVTPFSNNATICSYPRFCSDNPLPSGLSAAELDALMAEVNAGQTAELPTAVGFCMFIRRDCLDEVGAFDAELFGRGYGEENDFCLRADTLGWRNLLAADTFVYHAGGVSFAGTRPAQMEAGHRALLQRYPHYDALIQRFIAADALAPLRFAADLRRAQLSGLPRLLLISHGRGGGVDRHLAELTAALEGRAEIYLLQPLPGESGGRVSFGPVADEAVRLVFDPAPGFDPPALGERFAADGELRLDPTLGFEQLVATLRALAPDRIHFHHTVDLHPRVVRLPEVLGVPYDVTVHDFYLADPGVTRVGDGCRYRDPLNRFIDETEQAPDGGTLAQWRARGERFLIGAERVFAPSLDTARRLRNHFPALVPIVAPHEAPIDVPVRLPQLTAERPLRVAVLGALSPIKGADLLDEVALDARSRRLPLTFDLIGFAYRSLCGQPVSALTVHGPYLDGELEQKLAALAPDLVWFPGHCPETYSYTLSAALRCGLPVAAPAIGAFPERLVGRAWSWLLAPELDARAALEQLLALREQLLAGVPPTPPVGERPPRFTYPDDYLTPIVSTARGAPTEPGAIEWTPLVDGWRRLPLAPPPAAASITLF